MGALSPESTAPALPGVDFAAGPTFVFFYKVTCPVCQMAAPKVRSFQESYPSASVGVGQDPSESLAAFDERFGLGFRAISDEPPYELSTAYGVRVVPTAFLVSAEGEVLETVESWDREGLNRISARMAELTGSAYAPISVQGDGLPPFRPG